MLRFARLASPLLLLLALVATGRAEDPPPAAEEVLVGLREAVAAKQVEAIGERPSGYSRVSLSLTNLTDAPLAVDVCGARLGPETPRSCQRLGLGPSPDRDATRRPRPGVVVVDVAPRATRSVVLQTCCLDVRLTVPRSQRFHVLPQPAPPAQERVLRWWADHPNAPQGTVNSAIWAGRETVAWDPKTGPAAQVWGNGRYEPAVASCAGTVYQLVEGRLSALGEDGERRVLGSEIVRVIPTPDAVYAVFPLSGWKAELRRLALTGDDDDTWSLVATLLDDDVPVDVLAHPDGLLLVGKDRVLRLPPREARVESLVTSHGPVSARLDADGGATFVTSRPRQGEGWVATVHRLAPGGRAVSRVGEFWQLREVQAGGAGVFGLTHVGLLRRLRGAKLEPVVAEDVARILFVGRHVLWLRGKDGSRYAADPDTGREVSRIPRHPAEDDELVLDRVSGDLVGLSRGKWFRWKAKDGVVEELPAP